MRNLKKLIAVTVMISLLLCTLLTGALADEKIYTSPVFKLPQDKLNNWLNEQESQDPAAEEPAEDAEPAEDDGSEIDEDLFGEQPAEDEEPGEEAESGEEGEEPAADEEPDAGVPEGFENEDEDLDGEDSEEGDTDDEDSEDEDYGDEDEDDEDSDDEDYDDEDSEDEDEDEEDSEDEDYDDEDSEDEDEDEDFDDEDYNEEEPADADFGDEDIDEIFADGNGEQKRQVKVYTDQGEVITAGDAIKLKSKLIGFDGLQVAFQWQVNRNDGQGWVDIEGATREYYVFIADRNTISYDYRLIVNVVE